MTLRLIAENDLATILEGTSEGWPITLTDPAGKTEELFGYSGDISQTIDPETGVPVSGQLAHVAIRLTTLKALGFELPRGVADASSAPWVVEFADISGELRTYKVSSSDPDYTLGIVVCLLEKYNPTPDP